MSLILIKMPVKPHRQKVLIGEEGSEEEMRLNKWANRAAAQALREQGKPASGPEFEAMRDQMMEEAIADAGKSHGITFMDDPIPLSGPEEAPQEEPEDSDFYKVGQRDMSIRNETDIHGNPIEEEAPGSELFDEDGKLKEPAGAEPAEEEEPEVEAAPEGSESSAPTGQTSLLDWTSEKKTSFDPQPGDLMLKAVRAKMGW